MIERRTIDLPLAGGHGESPCIPFSAIALCAALVFAFVLCGFPRVSWAFQGKLAGSDASVDSIGSGSMFASNRGIDEIDPAFNLLNCVKESAPDARLCAQSLPEITESGERMAADYLFASQYFKGYLNQEREAPYKEYLKELREDGSFQAGYYTWLTTNVIFDAGSAAETYVHEGDFLGEQGFYETALLGILYKGSSSSDPMADFGRYQRLMNAEIKDYKGLAKLFGVDYVEFMSPSDFNPIDIGLDGLTDEQKQIMVEAVDSCDGIVAWDLSYSVGTKLLDEATTLDEYMQKVGKVIAVAGYTQDTVKALRLMAAECAGSGYENDLRDAANHLADQIESNYGNWEFIQDCISGGVGYVSGKAVSHMADWAIEGLGTPWGAAKIAYSGGKSLSNAWVSTDEHYESFMKMQCLETLEDVTSRTLRNARDDYAGSGGVKDAATVNLLMDLVMGEYSLGCDYASDYLELMDDTVVARIMRDYYGCTTSEAAIAQVKNERDSVTSTWEYARVMLGEMGARSTACHNAYASFAMELKDQKAFDAWCDISADIESVLGERPAVAAEVQSEVVVEGARRTGGLRFRSGASFADGTTLDAAGGVEFDNPVSLNHGTLLVDGSLSVGGRGSSYQSMELLGSAVNVAGDAASPAARRCSWAAGSPSAACPCATPRTWCGSAARSRPPAGTTRSTASPPGAWSAWATWS